MKMGRFEGMNGYFLKVCLVLFLILSISSFASLGRADDAMVLPKGRWMSSLGFDYYPEWDTQFNDSGDTESLAYDYNRELDYRVFPALTPYIDPNLGFSPSLGRSIVDFKKTATIFNILLSYALTDNLTIGVKIPYWTFKTKVDTALNKNSANLVKNIDPNTMAVMPFLPDYAIDPNYLFIPNYSNPFVEALKLTREEIIGLLSEGLDINGDGTPEVPGYGYKRFETWSESDIGDMELGLKYQYLNNEKWRLAFQGGVRLPTGRVDDPDNLVDYGFGGGNYDLILGLQNDYLGFEDWALNGTFRFTWQIPDKETLRVLYSVDQPLVPITQKEKVDRDMGDVIEIELGASYKMPKGFGISGTYGGFFKGPDRIKGAGGHYASMEDETEQTGHTLTVGVSYNNLEQVQKKVAKVPFQVSLSHWQRFAGKNLNKAQYVSLKGALFF